MRVTINYCDGCKHYLGGGCCRLNMEAECREGGGFELWEAKETSLPVWKYECIAFPTGLIAVSMLYGVGLYKLYNLIF